MRIVFATLAAAVALCPAPLIAAGKTAAPNATLTTPEYTQNFDTLAAAGTSQSLPAGFQLVENGTGGAANGVYSAGIGSSNAGNAYSFGTGADRALGSLASGSVGPIWYGGIFTNGLGNAITSLFFGYTGEQWRSGTATGDGLSFQYSLNATELDNGQWIDFAALAYTAANNTNAGAVDGNVFATPISGTIAGLSIANGQRFGFRWVDVDTTGSDHGVAVDNLTIRAGIAPVAPVPEPGTWALLILGFGAVGAALRRRGSRVAFA
ncbi:PEPxxWA-CTERM sorting domain-containing protein [Qipengyuania sediminis]|uniref:PEPxxWA-CTERM sorting domain-containing protein n=1 Tax=Qipengyuania sediminis TaxID=1532023 RepID=UPI0010592747|nr:PEPxxWA-CTERM sorting domain-containing protein [Qipengyuania sediminis]